MAQQMIACSHIPVVNGVNPSGTLGAYAGPFKNCFVMSYLNDNDTGSITLAASFDSHQQVITVNPGAPVEVQIPDDTTKIELAIQSGEGQVSGIFLSVIQNL